MGQHLLEVNMEHLKDHADYKYNKPRKINTKYSVIGKKAKLWDAHLADEKKRFFNEKKVKKNS